MYMYTSTSYSTLKDLSAFAQNYHNKPTTSIFQVQSPHSLNQLNEHVKRAQFQMVDDKPLYIVMKYDIKLDFIKVKCPQSYADDSNSLFFVIKYDSFLDLISMIRYYLPPLSTACVWKVQSVVHKIA
eukprot:TRINITY_DN1983_c0_g1_i2.p3 TRINITY_DN1983_c0_g1~~TRINITY_DN1983_c0_g1_i2.p3  ORF type:complete len:127 (+),score=1.10 TRINITY_DN1983_c0_g1_i2:660-1040(+)